MAENFDKDGIFGNIQRQLDSLTITKYETKDAYSKNTLDPTIVFTMLQMYNDGRRNFSYIVGGNSNVERALFCLNRLRMIHIYDNYTQSHEVHISCSLNNIGSAYIRSILGDHDPHRLMIHQFLFDACFEIIPFMLSILYVAWYGLQNATMAPLCVVTIGLGLVDLQGILQINIKTGNRFVYRKLDDTKAQFLNFCNQYAIWHYVKPHDLMRIIDRYMFNDYTYRKQSFVARHDVPWNRHYHG